MVPAVTVVVCTRDRPDRLEACLDALALQHFRDFDILVVDNGTLPATAELCERRGIRCIREPYPGLTRARNLGARAAAGALVAYVDDDAVAAPAWLGALIAPFADPAVAAVAGRTRYMKAHGASLVMTDDEAVGEVPDRPARVFDRATPDWFVQACFGGIGDGNTMAFRRHLLTDSVRFDERIGRGCLIEGGDEHVAFMSLISDGHRVARAPGAVVRHPVPGDPALRRAKRRRDLRDSVAYMLFLWSQFPGHRRDLLRFLGRAVRQRLTPAGASVAPQPPRLAKAQSVAAIAGGVRRYWQARAAWTAHARSANPTADLSAPRVVTLR